MKLSTLSLVFAILLAHYVQGQLAEPISASIAASIASSIGTTILNLHQWSNSRNFVPILNRYCTSSIKGRVRKLKWVYDGQFSCDGWPIVGSESGRASKSGAIEHAVRDFANKAVAANLITSDQQISIGK